MSHSPCSGLMPPANLLLVSQSPLKEGQLSLSLSSFVDRFLGFLLSVLFEREQVWMHEDEDGEREMRLTLTLNVYFACALTVTFFSLFQFIHLISLTVFFLYVFAEQVSLKWRRHCSLAAVGPLAPFLSPLSHSRQVTSSRRQREKQEEWGGRRFRFRALQMNGTVR